jgi:hypothetical protein
LSPDDAVEPGLEVGAGLELVERRVGLGERLLDEVLGVTRVAGHPHRRTVELVEERQGVALEARGAVVVTLGRHIDGRRVDGAGVDSGQVRKVCHRPPHYRRGETVHERKHIG